MATQILSKSSFMNRVPCTWLNRIAYAFNPLELPEITPIEPEALPLLFARDQGPMPGAYLVDDKSVSGRHAELRFRDQKFELVDLGSTNGTFVNDLRLPPNAPHQLKDGDLIQMGATFFCFRTGSFVQLTVPRTPTENDRLTSVCPAFINAVIGLRNAALTAEPVLLLGETGTGKEIFARMIHEASGRPGKYIAINTAGIPPALASAELFGVVKGAHSTADHERLGLIRTADRGTVLLDEIGDMPLDTQTILLRLLQEARVLAVGADETVGIDVRFVAATHRNPDDEKLLRRDLVARLRGITIKIPPLRRRIDDMGLLIGRILTELGASDIRFAADAYARMCLFDWPENVRQLYNVLRRATACRNREITVDMIEAAGIGLAKTPEPDEDTEPTPESARVRLREHNGNVASVARSLGMGRMAFFRFLKKHGIDPDAYRPNPRARDDGPAKLPPDWRLHMANDEDDEDENL
jgi:hypothetical protein